MLLCGLILLNRFWPAWGPGFDNSRMIVWDSYGYYLYLPAFFVYHDPGMENRDWVAQINDKYKPSTTFYQVTDGHENRLTIKYSMGTAVLWSPFFFVAHALAEPLGYPADGMSPPYSWAILLGGLLYAFIGLWYLRKVLLKFFSDEVTAITLLIITLGTNYWAQTASDTVMPHSTLCALNAVILWCVIRWHETKSYRHAIALGALIGVGTLSRPTEIFWILVPLLWQVTSWRTFVDKLRMFLGEWKKVLALSLAAAVFVLMQMSYWKFTSGNWVFYTYRERFNWMSPFLVEGLFSYKKGWLLYTPIMVFGFWGFYFVRKYARSIFLALAVFVFVFTWMILSWECWWYAACFSIRGMVEMYPAMAIVFGFLVMHLMAEKKWYRVPASVMMGLLVLLNLFQHWQYNHGIIHQERMTGSYYWKVFGTTKYDPANDSLLEVERWPEVEVMPAISELHQVDSYKLDFEPQSAFKHDSIQSGIAHSGSCSYAIGNGWEFGPAYEPRYEDLTQKGYLWIRSSVWICYDTTAPSQQPPYLAINYLAKDRSLKYKAIPLDTAGLRPGEWRLIQTDFITPNQLYSSDHLTIVVWNPGKVLMHMDDFQVDVYEPVKEEP